MKKSRFFLALSFVSLALVLIPTNAKAALWEVPTSLNPGDTFRWVFVTSGFSTAESADISTYNTFVNKAANIDTSISGVVGKSNIVEIGWKAIASTPTTNAIDNIGGYSPAGIYTPIGDLVANGTTDMFDEDDLYNPIKFTEAGEVVVANKGVWTGSVATGQGRELGELGREHATIGLATMSTDSWIDHGLVPHYSEFHRLYAISEELTVVPVPSALILAATGLLSSTLGLIRLRRKHQEPGQI
ncbi:MAG TPA: hypothetical protein DIU00_05640 [Phycisphaerales bacterium]|nr:hypothetical protein [Phycisphaerales bacterium]